MTDAEQREIEAKYWRDYNSGFEAGRICIKSTGQHESIELIAKLGIKAQRIKAQPEEAAYWTGLLHGARAHKRGIRDFIKRLRLPL